MVASTTTHFSVGSQEADLISQFWYVAAAAMHSGTFSLPAPLDPLDCPLSWRERSGNRRPRLSADAGVYILPLVTGGFTCCIPGYSNNSTKHESVGFRSFPRDRHLIGNWIFKLRREGRKCQWVLHNFKHICFWVCYTCAALGWELRHNQHNSEQWTSSFCEIM